jgi:putative chitinase
MILQLGSTGPFVEMLQKKLGVKADGNFGPVTQRALEEWQKSNGFDPNGQANREVLQKMGVLKKSLDVNFKRLINQVPSKVVLELVSAAYKFNINSNLRLAHFLAQCGQESGDFKALVENLNYSEAGLKKTFAKYFPDNLAKEYVGDPEKIASRVYGNRMGNGNEESGEGWKYRGRGYIQLTGKANYQAFGKFMGEDFVANPDLVATEYPLSSAAFFFDRNRIWSICDKGATAEVVKEVTRKVNGGYHGLEGRLKRFEKFYKLLQ